MEIFKVTIQLFFTTLVIGVSSPNLQFNYIADSQIIDNHIHTIIITCLSLNIIITYPIDNRTQVSKEDLSAIFLQKLVIFI